MASSETSLLNWLDRRLTPKALGMQSAWLTWATLVLLLWPCIRSRLAM
jgi:hypothetical protein